MPCPRTGAGGRAEIKGEHSGGGRRPGTGLRARNRKCAVLRAGDGCPARPCPSRRSSARGRPAARALPCGPAPQSSTSQAWVLDAGRRGLEVAAQRSARPGIRISAAAKPGSRPAHQNGVGFPGAKIARGAPEELGIGAPKKRGASAARARGQGRGATTHPASPARKGCGRGGRPRTSADPAGGRRGSIRTPISPGRPQAPRMRAARSNPSAGRRAPRGGRRAGRNAARPGRVLPAAPTSGTAARARNGTRGSPARRTPVSVSRVAPRGIGGGASIAPAARRPPGGRRPADPASGAPASAARSVASPKRPLPDRGLRGPRAGGRADGAHPDHAGARKRGDPAPRAAARAGELPRASGCAAGGGSGGGARPARGGKSGGVASKYAALATDMRIEAEGAI